MCKSILDVMADLDLDKYVAAHPLTVQRALKLAPIFLATGNPFAAMIVDELPDPLELLKTDALKSALTAEHLEISQHGLFVGSLTWGVNTAMQLLGLGANQQLDDQETRLDAQRDALQAQYDHMQQQLIDARNQGASDEEIRAIGNRLGGLANQIAAINAAIADLDKLKNDQDAAQAKAEELQRVARERVRWMMAIMIGLVLSAMTIYAGDTIIDVVKDAFSGFGMAVPAAVGV